MESRHTATAPSKGPKLYSQRTRCSSRPADRPDAALRRRACWAQAICSAFVPIQWTTQNVLARCTSQHVGQRCFRTHAEVHDEVVPKLHATTTNYAEHSLTTIRRPHTKNGLTEWSTRPRSPEPTLPTASLADFARVKQAAQHWGNAPLLPAPTLCSAAFSLCLQRRYGNHFSANIAPRIKLKSLATQRQVRLAGLAGGGAKGACTPGRAESRLGGSGALTPGPPPLNARRPPEGISHPTAALKPVLLYGAAPNRR